MTYSIDFRKQVLKIREKEGLSVEGVALRFGVGKASVMRWLIELEPKKTRNKSATKIDMEALKKDVEKSPDSYQYERAERVGASQSGIYWALKRLDVTYKKTVIHPKTDEEKRLLYQNKLNIYHASSLDVVYLDHSGFAHDMPRTHGYALKGQRCYGTKDWGARGRTNAIGALLGERLLSFKTLLIRLPLRLGFNRICYPSLNARP